jgi:hypothetical protein
MRCEKCLSSHSGAYGSGRFCNARCARSFASSLQRSEINVRVSSALKGRPSPFKGIKRGRKVQPNFKWSEQAKARIKKKNAEKNALLPFDKLSLVEKRRRILVEQNNACPCGQNQQWNGSTLVLQLDHINGIKTDNTRSNLRFLCPNCHSQTETFAARNIKRLKMKNCFHRPK